MGRMHAVREIESRLLLLLSSAGALRSERTNHGSERCIHASTVCIEDVLSSGDKLSGGTLPLPHPAGSKACLPSSYRLTFGESTIRVRICTFSPGQDEGIAR
jgi:hypothetical protein